MTSLSTVERRQRATMRMLRHYVDKLPVTSHSAKALRSLPRDSPLLPDTLERLAARDPTLAIRMLYLANHTFLAPGMSTVTLGSVLARIGASAVAAGLSEFVAAPVLVPTATEVHDLWIHSAQVAAVAAHLALKTPQLALLAAEAYLAGLLHDLGRFVMLVAAPEAYGRISDREWRDGSELLAAEVEVSGFHHTVLGWLGCRAWNFPDSLAAVNRHHHEWTTIDKGAYGSRTLTLIRIVGLADDLAFAWADHKGDVARLDAQLAAGQAHVSRETGIALALGSSESLIGELERVADSMTVEGQG